MPIKTSPPKNSMRKLNRFPKKIPMRLPVSDMTNDAKPIASSGSVKDTRLLYPVKANEIPTAKASMLVATAKVSITFSRVGSKLHSSMSLKYSRIILMPKKANKPKAIQGS